MIVQELYFFGERSSLELERESSVGMFFVMRDSSLSFAGESRPLSGVAESTRGRDIDKRRRTLQEFVLYSRIPDMDFMVLLLMKRCSAYLNPHETLNRPTRENQSHPAILLWCAIHLCHPAVFGSTGFTSCWRHRYPRV